MGSGLTGSGGTDEDHSQLLGRSLRGREGSLDVVLGGRLEGMDLVVQLKDKDGTLNRKGDRQVSSRKEPISTVSSRTMTTHLGDERLEVVEFGGHDG